MIQCKKCGADLDDSAKFCGKCGTPVGAEEVSQEVSQEASPEVKTSPLKLQSLNVESLKKMYNEVKDKKVTKIIAVVVAIAVLGLVISIVVSSGKCEYSGCKNATAEDSDYCFNHKCNLCDEAKTSLSTKYCYLHYLTNEKAESNSSNSSSNASSDLKFSNISVSHNSSYTVVTGSVTNRGSRTYKFVKVKGAFKSSAGTVLDTDWTYAVGSEGLSPGETKTFRMSVSKNVSIRKCDITITDYQ